MVDSVNRRFLEADARAGYGFSNHIIIGSAGLALPLGSFDFSVRGGLEITDLNSTEPISPLWNSLYSLFERENYQKLYQKQYVSASLHRRIIGGWQATVGVEWADRKWLPNTSSYSFFSPAGHNYTSNNPLTPDQDIPLFPQNQSFKLTFRTTYDFSNKYETYPDGRRYLPSPYPTVGFNYVKGISGLFGSDVDYDLVSFDVSKSDIPVGIFGNTSFYLGAGKFINSSSLFYPDYKQFAGNQILFCKNGINSFLLLDYYTFSTYKQYAEGHFEQNFSGFFLNKIPLIRKLKLQEIVDFNYLYTPELKNYMELGLGIQYLNFRLMYGQSFNSGSNLKTGVRIGVSF